MKFKIQSLSVILLLFVTISSCIAQKKLTNEKEKLTKTIPGAERISSYLPLLKNKKIAIFANQTSMVGNKHLVDTLRKLGVNISVIFGPEHGFRGTADAGEKVGNYVDAATGIPVVSLYGSKRRPSADDLKGIDIMMFDIQDVGARFYTYISSLQEYMEAAIENNLPVILLDRPNPNGHYVDGPVLDTAYRSFVGMQPVPVVYGMTIGEYAKMIYGEKWIKNPKNASLDLTVITNDNYDHNTKYVPPVRPSPNLPEIQSIYLFPSTCFFEGTTFSEGRGTAKPFQYIGHPDMPKTMFSFIPNPNEGAKSSKQYGITCYGWNLSGTPEEVLTKLDNRIQLKWLLEAYRLFPDKEKFFILPKSGKMNESFFNKLAGNNILWQQVKNSVPEEEIRKSWQPSLSKFKEIRKKYLLYPDFE